MSDGILAQPPRPGRNRVCPLCQTKFALQLVSSRDDELQGAITVYHCSHCDREIAFAERHPPHAI